MSDTELSTIQTPPGGTRLIDKHGMLEQITLRRETDARTALARGLTEYVAQLSTNIEGRDLSFKKVFHTWAEPENPGLYPGACVWSNEAGNYDDERLTPGVTEATDAPGHYIIRPCEFVHTFFLEVWCTGVTERMAIAAMLEDAFNPVEWMYGFRLEVPHYHNVRCEFEPLSLMYQDTEDDARRRFRKMVIALTGRIPVCRVKGEIAKMRPSARFTFGIGPERVPTGIAGPDGEPGTAPND